MFCSEPIMHIYQRTYCGEKERPWHNAILRLTGNIEYHATEGHWLVLQTKHFVISLGYDGVQRYTQMDDFCVADELVPLSDIDDWTTTEETLLVGERIHSVNGGDGHWDIAFDHFTLSLYGYREDTAKAMERYTNATNDYVPLAVGDHLLKRQCTCGGEGQIFLDFVSDHLVRCKNCHASTLAGICLIDAIEDWNNGDTPILLNTAEDRFFKKVIESPIRYVALADQGFWYATEQSCQTDRAVFAFDDESYFVESLPAGEASFFVFRQCSNYNKSMFSHTIAPHSGHIRFLKANDSLGACLYFVMDNTLLRVAPFDTYLIIALTGGLPDGISIQDLDRDRLLEWE